MIPTNFAFDPPCSLKILKFLHNPFLSFFHGLPFEKKDEDDPVY